VPLNPTNISTHEELDKIVARLEIDGHDRTLPANWIPRKRPVRSLPIDNFITSFVERTRKPRLRSPVELTCYPLGECPYAMARSGVSRAIKFAFLKNNFFEVPRAFTTAKLKDLKKGLPSLERTLFKVASYISAIAVSQEQFEEFSENDWRPFRTLEYHLLAAAMSIQAAMPQIRSLHLERSQFRGIVWRHAFVSSLFGSWWLLTGSDPSSRSAPFLEFVQACWLSLSPDEDLPDLGWEGAIATCLKNASEKWWCDMSPDEVLHSQASSEALDRWVEEQTNKE
jgi:hypothetical protein